jgi:signal transduction histidine kinase/CheY-like chemotaxis protein
MGSSPGLLVGSPLWRFDGSGATSPQRPLLEAALRAGRPFLGEWVLPKSGGEHAITELQMSPVLVQGRLAQFVFTFRDVTERKRMEGQLVLAERMASVGLVAAGLGHEINNPLSFVLTNLQVLEEELDILRTSERAALARMRDCVHDALHGARRVRQIVRSLKVLSREAAQERSIVQLDQMVELTLALSGPTLRQRAEVVKSLGRTPLVEGNEARLGQVLLNLLLNAMQAIPEGAQPGRIEVTTGADAEGNAFLEVRDSGSGIADGALSRLFEPFFTTKPAGEGTGLGLFICRQIVDEHGGRIDVETAPGKGSCFRVLLPPAQGGLVPVEVEAARTVVRRGRVLVVDDEVRLAASIRMLLSPMHDAETCAGGQEALDHLSKGGQYDVILCDLQMPQVSGVEFFQRLGALRPELTPRFVFMSGGAWSEEAREFVRRTSNVVLEKPVPPDVLMRVVEEGVHRVYPSE